MIDQEFLEKHHEINISLSKTTEAVNLIDEIIKNKDFKVITIKRWFRKPVFALVINTSVIVQPYHNSGGKKFFYLNNMQYNVVKFKQELVNHYTNCDIVLRDFKFNDIDVESSWTKHQDFQFTLIMTPRQ